MSGISSPVARATLTPDDVARLVEHRTASGGKVVDLLIYVEDKDLFAILSGHLALLIDRAFIDEFKGFSPAKLRDVKLSPAGTTIMLEDYDIHIEAAGL